MKHPQVARHIVVNVKHPQVASSERYIYHIALLSISTVTIIRLMLALFVTSTVSVNSLFV